MLVFAAVTLDLAGKPGGLENALRELEELVAPMSEVD